MINQGRPESTRWSWTRRARGSPGYRVLRALVRGILRRGWRLRVEGLEQLPPQGPYIIIANHGSEIDPIVLSAALPFRPTYLAARDLQRFPVLFAIMRLFDPVFVRRGLSDVGAIKACLERLKRAEVLAVFPEGRVVQQSDLGPMHPGAAFLAIRAGVPVVPVALSGVTAMWPLGAWRPHRSRLTVRIGNPIVPPSRDGDRAQAMTETIRQSLATLLGGNTRAQDR